MGYQIRFTLCIALAARCLTASPILGGGPRLGQPETVAAASPQHVESLLNRTLNALQQAYGQVHPMVATAQHNLGTFYQARHRYLDAERMYRLALATDLPMCGLDAPVTARDLASLGSLALARHHYADAKALLNRSAPVSEKTGLTPACR